MGVHELPQGSKQLRAVLKFPEEDYYAGLHPSRIRSGT